MYALANIEKFVKDNLERLGGRAKGIIKRAKKAAWDSVIFAGSIKEIMQDEGLAAKFHMDAMTYNH